MLLLALVPAWGRAMSPEDYYNAGVDLFQNHDYEKAVQYFRAAVGERSDYWQAYQFLGEAYYQSANRTEAVVAMEASLKIHPNNPDLRKFVAKIKDDSPWVADGSWSVKLSVLSILLCLLTLGWTVFWTYRFGLKKGAPPPKA